MSVERYTVKGMPKTIWLNLGDDDSEFDFGRLSWRDLEEVTWTPNDAALVVAIEYRLASDYAALEAERDAIRSDFDALGAHYREALAERDKWKARAEAAEKLAIGSIRFMKEDFPEAPEEIDDACVSSAYLNHYESLLNNAEYRESVVALIKTAVSKDIVVIIDREAVELNDAAAEHKKAGD